MTSPAKKAKIDDPNRQDPASETGSAVIEPRAKDNIIETPPATQKKDLRAPRTSGTFGTTATAYTDALDGFESHDSDESRGIASPTLKARGTPPLPQGRTSPSVASAMEVHESNAAPMADPEVDETNAAPMADPLAQQSFHDSATKKTGENGLAVNSVAKRVNCYNHMMPYTKIFDEGDFAEHVTFKGKVIVTGPTDSGKSIFIDSFVDPTGQSRLLPAALGSCTKYIIEIQTVRCMDLSLSPMVNVYLPGEEPLEDCSISEAHDGIQKFMNASSVTNSSILPIRVTVVSPHVPDGVTIVDTPGIDPNVPESVARIRKFIAKESEPISIIFCISPFDIGYADMAFQKVQECLLERNLPFNDSFMILMSNLDRLIDPNYNEKVNPEATSPAWRVYSALTFSGEFDKARVLPNYRENLFGIRNPDTGVLARSESEKGDLIDREDKFMEDNGLTTLSDVMVGHRKIAMHLNDTIIPVHIYDSVREIEAELCSELQGAKKNLADLGADPIETGFAERAMEAFDMSVALQFLPTTNKIGDGVALENSPLLKIVESVANNTDLFSFGFDARNLFIDKLKAAILTFAIQTVETRTREVEEPGNMRLRRFWRRALVKYKDEVEYLLGVASERFAQECEAEIELSQRLSRLLPRTEASGIRGNLKISLANFAATIFMKSIYDQINDGCVRVRRGVVDFTEDDSSIRRERDKRIKDLEEKLALLRRLPVPKSLPKKTNATDSSENHNKECDGDEDGGGDGPTGRPRKGGDSNGSKQDAKSPFGAGDDGGDGRGGGGNISSVGGGGKATMCSRIALERAPTSPAMVSEQSPSESDGSDTDVEDLDPPKARAMSRTSNGRGRSNTTLRKLSQATRTSSSSTKRKQNGAGGSSKEQTSHRSKGARLTFKVGMRIETHFPKPKKGWYEGEITEKKKGINTITYSYDGPYHEASDKQLSQEIRDGKQRLL